MFVNTTGELITSVKKEVDGISFELTYKMNLSADEIAKLKNFRENFGKTSPIHFHFNESNFAFSQKKYLKKSQFVENPPNLEEIEKSFFSEIKLTLSKFKNLLKYELTENSENTKTVNIDKVLE